MTVRTFASHGGVVLALTVFVMIATGPFVWLILSSFLQQQALISSPPDLSPSSFTLANFREVLGSAAFLGKGLANSVIVAGFTTFLAILIGAPAAYALARLEVMNQDALLLLILAAQMFPAIVIVIPLFIAASKLGLIDTQFNLILVYLSFNLPVVIWVLRGFFVGCRATSSERRAWTAQRSFRPLDGLSCPCPSRHYSRHQASHSSKHGTSFSLPSS